MGLPRNYRLFGAPCIRAYTLFRNVGEVVETLYAFLCNTREHGALQSLRLKYPRKKTSSQAKP